MLRNSHLEVWCSYWGMNTVNDELEQQPLWTEEPLDPTKRDLQDTLERARAAWQQIRLHHAIGSAEEEQYWLTYRSASDRYWQFLQRRT